MCAVSIRPGKSARHMPHRSRASTNNPRQRRSGGRWPPRRRQASMFCRSTGAASIDGACARSGGPRSIDPASRRFDSLRRRDRFPAPPRSIPPCRDGSRSPAIARSGAHIYLRLLSPRSPRHSHRLTPPSPVGADHCARPLEFFLLVSAAGVGNMTKVGATARRDGDPDQALFQDAMRDVIPLADRDAVGPVRGPRTSARARSTARHSSRLTRDEAGSARAPGVSHAQVRDLAGGRPPATATLDLHHHTLATAQTRLAAFLEQSRAAHHRAVLVITGRGLPLHRPRSPARARPSVAGRPSGRRPACLRSRAGPAWAARAPFSFSCAAPLHELSPPTRSVRPGPGRRPRLLVAGGPRRGSPPPPRSRRPRASSPLGPAGPEPAAELDRSAPARSRRLVAAHARGPAARGAGSESGAAGCFAAASPRSWWSTPPPARPSTRSTPTPRSTRRPTSSS